ncbi:ribonuclease H-like domain-containing protein [Aspergillus lucknowensis]|uniref:Ribonuclease H-like domain-containing protein n=1 Tax=Aspergillus lucknowensis TaxID=176173 RepID=A0ABR4LIT1_9EURO
MDVTAQTFPYHLPRILEDLASSAFVAIDLEFSGIATAPQGRAGPPQTLQQRYQEVKEGADRYQILQVGLTFCHEDIEAAKYTLRPYNLYLSPIIDRKLDVERNWSFQSSAVEFLLENKFNMDSLYRTGVPYISREEEEKAISKAVERQNRTPTSTSLDVKDTDHDSRTFLSLVRQLIDNWLALGDKRDDYLNIPPPTRQIKSQKLEAMPSALNRFQKRLVHQVVEVEYPSLVTIGRPTFVQIISYDEDREKAVRDKRVQWVRERIWKETGFRWVAEALAGGDLSRLNPHYFSGIKANSSRGEQAKSAVNFADDFKERLKAHRPVLVGHNLFMDLVYFFRCFFGPLPERLDDFQSMVHEHFPVLIDTKYLATHDCGSINPTSSLQEINDSLLQTPTPVISIHPHFARYHIQKIDHEAGYDSLLTAQVFIKLSAQLGARDQTYIPTGLISTKASHSTAFNDLNNRFARHRVPGTSEGSLGSGPADSESKETVEQNEKFLVGESLAGDVWRANKKHLVPRQGSQFWKTYGNKLRVFGTGPSIAEQRVCRSCQETLVRRNYASASTPVSPESSSATSSTFPVVKPTYTINAGVLLSRPPQITRDLTDFEKAFYFYQKRLNERLVLPFTKYFYFKRGTPADEDWKRKVRERQTAARDIGKYSAYSKEAWNDELLVGAPESDPDHLVETLIQDAESTANATSQDTSKKEEIPRPFPRVTEADKKGDTQSLNRALQRTLYLLVQSKEGYWKFPSSPVVADETLRLAAERTLEQSAGVNMNTFMIGYHPVGHYVYNSRKSKTDEATGATIAGEKTFFMKSRIMAGQADLSANVQNLKDFKWLAKEEIAKFVLPPYYASIKNMLAER